MREGWLPDHEGDQRFVTGSWKLLISGSRILMTLLMKKKKMERIHYSDFLAFGTDRLLQPENMVETIDRELTCGNDKVNALAAHITILKAQMTASTGAAELSFATQIPDEKKDGLTNVQLNLKCSRLGEHFRNTVDNVLKEIERSGVANQFRQEQVLSAN